MYYLNISVVAQKSEEGEMIPHKLETPNFPLAASDPLVSEFEAWLTTTPTAQQQKELSN